MSQLDPSLQYFKDFFLPDYEQFVLAARHIESESLVTSSISGYVTCVIHTMKAVVRDRFGPPDVLEIRDMDRPEAPDDGALIRVHASSVNPADWHALAGTPYIARAMGVGLRRPKIRRIGTDFAGVIETVGQSVKEFRPGDKVFGMRTGALAEYVTVSEAKLAAMPSNLSFEEAAAVPVAAMTALQALRTKGNVQPGQRVLINGASGGVGTFAVQIAKSLGADVTGVCSTGKVELIRGLGADRVFDYNTEDFTAGGGRYDLMIDNVCSRSFSAYRKVLTPEATVVIVGGAKKTPLLGPMGKVALDLVQAMGKSQKLRFFIAQVVKDDMVFLGDLMEQGRVRSVIDRRYDLSDIADAFRYLGEGHAAGKIVVTI